MAYTGTAGFWSDAWDWIKEVKVTLPPPPTTFPSNYPSQFPYRYPVPADQPAPEKAGISPETILLVGGAVLLLTMSKRRK